MRFLIKFFTPMILELILPDLSLLPYRKGSYQVIKSLILVRFDRLRCWCCMKYYVPH